MKRKFNGKKMGAVVTVAVLAAVLAVAVNTDAMAGTGGAAFDDVWQTIRDWTTGYLGKAIALGMVLYGIGMGVAKQNLAGFATGMGGGVGLNYSPAVIDTVVSATVAPDSLVQIPAAVVGVVQSVPGVIG